jgi:hypothetical protein
MTCLVIFAAHVQANGYYMLNVPTLSELEFVREFEMTFCDRYDIVWKVEGMLVVA